MKNKKYSVCRQKEPHSLPLSTDIGALRTRFHPNLLLHLFVIINLANTKRKRQLLILFHLTCTLSGSLQKRHKTFFLDKYYSRNHPTCLIIFEVKLVLTVFSTYYQYAQLIFHVQAGRWCLVTLDHAFHLKQRYGLA